MSTEKSKQAEIEAELHRVRLETADHCARLAERVAAEEDDATAAEMAIYVAGYIRRHYCISGVQD